MKVKTAELIGPALDWAVSMCEGISVGILSVEEQINRFMCGVTPQELEKWGREYEAIYSKFNSELCLIQEDGYKTAVHNGELSYSTEWALSGPIIEREGINTFLVDDIQPVIWRGERADPFGALRQKQVSLQSHIGPTPLVAAMRCYCCVKLGDEIDVPDELMK